MKKETNKTTLHGTAVVLEGGSFEPSVVFFRGRSGMGKSDLAFRLIAKGATLVGDDQVSFEKRLDKIYVSSVESNRGLLEVRGVGMLHYPVAAPGRLRLVVDLVSREDMPRMPPWETADILGVQIPKFSIYAFDISSTLKVQKMMEIAHKPELTVR